MGAFLDKPNVEKTTTAQMSPDKSLLVGVSAMQGWRIDMEDSHTVAMSLPGAPGTSFFAVFDGHGGSLVSTVASTAVLAKVLASPEWAEQPRTPEKIGEAMRKGFLAIDEELKQHPEVTHGEDRSGSTAIAVVVTPTHVICANCGDSRSVMVRGGGASGDAAAEEMSYDHKPYNPVELRRIQAAGGTVTMKRVNGDLAVSRALGDFVYKHRDDLPAEQQQVSAEPDIKIVERRADDVALVLACDGIWDVMSNAEVSDFVLAHALGSAAEIKVTTEALLDECLHKGSRDNMSAVIVAFPGGQARVVVKSETGGASS